MLKNLGETIRLLRKEKKLTLVEISKKTNVAQATLSRIETGTMIGTVESHQKIADILGVSLAELYSGVDPRHDQIAHLKLDAERKVTHHTKSLQVELLTQESSKKKITPLLMTLQPDAEASPEKNERGVEKFIYVLEGEIKVKVDKEEFHLKQGETLYFDASLSHQISNQKKASKLLIAVSPSKI
jgi:mannose-6-phosphate isomerase-like protein (cupin superfamily)